VTPKCGPLALSSCFSCRLNHGWSNSTGVGQLCAECGSFVLFVDSPVHLSEDLSFEEAVEPLSIEVLVAHPLVDAVDPGVVPPTTRVNEGRAGTPLKRTSHPLRER